MVRVLYYPIVSNGRKYRGLSQSMRWENMGILLAFLWDVLGVVYLINCSSNSICWIHAAVGKPSSTRSHATWKSWKWDHHNLSEDRKPQYLQHCSTHQDHRLSSTISISWNLLASALKAIKSSFRCEIYTQIHILAKNETQCSMVGNPC